jgi:antitoxin HicB
VVSRLKGAAVSATQELKMDKEYSFSVILDPQEEGGFTVTVSGLPEVVTEGDTREEALVNAREAIELALAYRRDHGLPIPAPTTPEVRSVTVAA